MGIAVGLPLGLCSLQCGDGHRTTGDLIKFRRRPKRKAEDDIQRRIHPLQGVGHAGTNLDLTATATFGGWISNDDAWWKDEKARGQ